MSNFRALNIAATGMSAQQKRVDTAANNLANSNTTGLKKVSLNLMNLLTKLKEQLELVIRLRVNIILKAFNMELVLV